MRSGGERTGKMIGRTTRRRLVLARAAVLTVGVCCFALLTGTEARGAAPSQIRFVHTESFTDASSCSFPIEVNLTVTTVGRDYFDNAGNFLGEALHYDIIGTDTANGITLKESDHYQDVFYPSDVVKEVGVPIHI